MLKLAIIIAGITIARWSLSITVIIIIALTTAGIATMVGAAIGRTIIIAGTGGTTASRISHITEDNHPKQETAPSGAVSL